VAEYIIRRQASVELFQFHVQRSPNESRRHTVLVDHSHIYNSKHTLGYIVGNKQIPL